jgi:hypothetical protein
LRKCLVPPIAQTRYASSLSEGEVLRAIAERRARQEQPGWAEEHRVGEFEQMNGVGSCFRAVSTAPKDILK